MKEHWSTKYLGLPYALGGRSRAGVDCWGLLALVYEQEFGIALPHVPGIASACLGSAHALRDAQGLSQLEQQWRPLTSPADGCGVALSQRDMIHHVGVWVAGAGGRVLHVWERQPVALDTLRTLRFKGFRTFLFYQHNEISLPTPSCVGA